MTRSLASLSGAGAFAGNWTRLSKLNPLDDGFRPASPGIENPVVTKSQDGKQRQHAMSHSISCRASHFEQTHSKLRVIPGNWWIAVYHIYTGATVGVSFSRDGLQWTRQEGDLLLGDEHCGNTVTTACGVVPEPSLGKGVYSFMYTASGR